MNEFITHLKSNPTTTVTALGSILLTYGIGVLWKQWSKWKRLTYLSSARLERLIIITGCDSGLGFSMAYWAAKLGYNVIAGCLNYESDGGQLLRKEFGLEQVFVVQLDVTNRQSMQNFYEECQKFMVQNNSIRPWAVILNACVGGFGEFFWHTEEQQQRLFNVNFWGAVNFTKLFEPIILTHKSRLIVVTSDCADLPLPTLSIYSATKAALQTWALSLRQEVAKYGISVVAFQPGAFPYKSNLFFGQAKFYEEMTATMSPASLEFYGSYFRTINENFIKVFNKEPKTFSLIDDSVIYQTFISVLEEDVSLRPIVAADEFFAKVYHFLRKYLPIKYQDKVVEKIMNYPDWKNCKYQLNTKINGDVHSVDD